MAAFPGCCCVEKAVEAEMDINAQEMRIIEEGGEILIEAAVEKTTGFNLEPYFPPIDEQK